MRRSSGRILFISQTASAIGGVETWLAQIYGVLRQGPWQPIVGLVRGVTYHHPERFRSAYPEFETIEIDGRGLTRTGRVRAVERCIRKVRPDITVPLVVADAHAAVARAKMSGIRTKYLLAIHGNVPRQIANVRDVSEFVDLCVCPGRLTAALVAEMGVPRGRVLHIPNGAAPPSIPRRKRAHGQPIRLGYVGRLSADDKRVGDLVGFCGHLNQAGVTYTLDIVGDGPVREDLERALAPDRGFPMVRFRGSMSVNDIYREIYPNLDSLVMFSESEAFGIAIIEAMMHGIVPVSSRFVGQAAEGILEHGVTGMLFDVGDTLSAAMHVRRLDQDGALFNAVSSAGQARVTDAYSWDVCTSAWLQAFARIVELSPRLGSQLTVEKRARDQNGMLDRLRVPEGASDQLRRLRRYLVGVPDGMRGGEEWPWAYPDQSGSRETEIKDLVRRLDQKFNIDRGDLRR